MAIIVGASMTDIDVRINDRSAGLVFGSADPFLRVLTPSQPTPQGSESRNTHMVYPPGDISFLFGIAAIGTKFTTAAQQGPARNPNFTGNHRKTYEDTLWMFVGELGTPRT